MRIFPLRSLLIAGLFFLSSSAGFSYAQGELQPKNSGSVHLTNSTRAEPRWVELPSELPSGVAANDVVWIEWFPASGGASATLFSKKPAVVLIHPLARQDQSPMRKYARILSSQGISCAVLTLPYHGRRRSEDEGSVGHFVNADTQEVVETLQQSVSDVKTVLTWMSAQPNVDSQKLGAIGISIGAIITHLAMGQDARLTAGVAALGGGDLADTYRQSPLAQWKLLLRLLGVSNYKIKPTDADLEKLKAVDPLTYAAQNQPRRVLMIQAARDVVVPPRSAEVLWDKLGRPPIQWIDTNHFAAINLASDSTARTSIAYLKSVWNGAPLACDEIPRAHAPTFKAGFLMNLDSRATPAVQWQFLGIGTWKHRTLIGANAGISGHGPFIGIAANVTSYFDLGVGRRLNGNRFRPYASLHFVY
jgi:dienelactone hydrolase